MTTKKNQFWLILAVLLFLNSNTMAYEKAYLKTEVGKIQIIDLAPTRIIEAEVDGSYFDSSNGLFSKLFKYISDNDIAMTVPVEGNLVKAKMRFYIGSEVSSEIKSTNAVTVINFSSRTVVSIGGRGAYSEDNINEAKRDLEDWLKKQSDWSQSGEPYAVYWNGPFTPWFVKRFDVHIPIEKQNVAGVSQGS